MATAVRTGGPVEMLEESTHLLRSAPPGAIAAYLAGAVPFLVGFLFFWTEMSSSRDAEANSFIEALGVAALFVWLNWWKAVFAGRLMRQLEGTGEPAWTLRRAWRILAMQASVQPLKLLVLPAAAVAMLPAASACAFFRNVTALADRDAAAVKEARRLAPLWRKQNWIALAILTAFALVVFLNVALTLLMLPHLVRMLTGYESEFARSGINFALNWTFVAVAAGITWLCVDPFAQAYYVLRCFLGQAVTTGADLRAELRSLARAAVLVVLVLCGAGLSAGQTAKQAEPPSAHELNRAIDEVLAQREYRWRLPRAAGANRPFGSAMIRFTEQVLGYVRGGVRFVGKWISRFIRWLQGLLGSPEPAARDSGRAPSTLLRVSLLLLALLAAGGAVALFFRSRRRRARTSVSSAAVAAIDLNDESLSASQLPEETWMALADEWIGKQDLRMALRALYLGTLAYLGRVGLLAIHACKSNREYETELWRKSRATPEIPPLFRDNLKSFERSWYGRHEVASEEVGRFRANIDQMKSLAAAGGGGQ